MFNLVIILALVNIINIAKSETSLVVYRNVNSTLLPIKSMVTAKSGESLSLTCKLSFNDKMVDSPVVWRKQASDLRFQNDKGFKWFINNLKLTESSTLRFVSVSSQDEGTYFCSSVRYNLSQTVFLFVQSEATEKRHGRQKRLRLSSGFAQLLPTNVSMTGDRGDPKSGKELLAKILGNPKDKERNINMNTVNSAVNRNGGFNLDFFNEGTDSWTGSKKSYGTSNMGTSWPSHPYESVLSKLTSENSLGNSSASLNNLYKKVETDYTNMVNDNTNFSRSKSEYSVLYFMATIGGLLLFSGIMCICIRNNPNLRMQLERQGPVNDVTCNGFELAQEPFTRSDAVMTIVTVDRLTDTANRSPIPLESPPSYANSIRYKNNIQEDPPPTYDEAVANEMRTPSYYVYFSRPAVTPDVAAGHTSGNQRPDVILDPPHSFARFIPRVFVNRR